MRKKISLWFYLLSLWFFIVILIFFGWSVNYIDNGGSKIEGLNKTIITIAEFPNLIKATFREIFSLTPLMLENKNLETRDIWKKNAINDDGYILISSYDKRYNQSTVKLFRLQDSRILHTWTFNIEQFKSNYSIFNKIRKSEFRMIHPLLLSNGSIVFNYMDGPLICIDTKSNIKWVLKGKFHHSIELDVNGDIWVPNIIPTSSINSSLSGILRNDALTKVSDNGKILFQKSVLEILIENGYRGLLLGIGNISYDQIHLNDIQPSFINTKYWLKSDLLISLRNLSTVFLYDPITNKIKWLKTGPWLNQHDVDFIDSARIGVFGNNLVRSIKGTRIQPGFLIDGHNEEYIYDFSKKEISTPYTKFLIKSNVKTLTEGRSDILENGDLFVEETNFGRLLRGNSNNEIWSLVDRVNNRMISKLGWSRYISRTEFNEKFSKINFN